MGRWCGRLTAVSGLLVAAGIASPGIAQSAPEAPPEPARPNALRDPDEPTPWTIQIEPVLWFAGPSGKVKLPVTSGTGPGQFTTEGDKVRLSALDLDNTLLRPAGSARIGTDRWRFTIAGADYSTSRPGTVASDSFRVGAVDLAPGDRFDADFSLGVYEMSVGYCVWDHDFKRSSQSPDDAVPVLVKLFVLIGGRAYDVKFDILRTSGSPASAGVDEFFVEPVAGVRAEAEITRSFGIDFQLTAGAWPVGDHSSNSFDVAIGFHYRPFENVGVQLGYRQLVVGLQDGADLGHFEYDGSIAGLYTGIVIRF